MKSLKIMKLEEMTNELSKGMKVIIDLAIPNSEFLPESTSFYVCSNSNKLCLQKIETIRKSHKKCIAKINEENQRNPFKDFESVEFFIKDNFERDEYLSFIRLFKEFVIFSFFSNPLVLKNLPINLIEKDIRNLLVD